MEWVSLGGGIHFTKKDYPVKKLIKLLKDFSSKFGVQVYLEPGEHLISFSKEWYFSQSQVINISSENDNKIFQKLNPFALLEISSEPSGANVLVNGLDSGKTPFVLEEVNPGKYSFEFLLEGYVSSKGELNVKPGANYFKGKLAVKEFSFTLTSVPESVAIVDSIEIGLTPVQINMPRGTHYIHLVSGELEWMKDISLEENTEMKVDLKREATVIFEIIPAGEAFIVNNGNKFPADSIINTYEGMQTFEILRGGYPERRRIYMLSGGKIYNFRINLEGETSLFIVSNPAGADVYWMGAYLGKTPLRDFRTRPGTGILKLLWGGGELEEKLTFNDGQTYTIFRELPGRTKVWVDSFPYGLKVFLDGNEAGITPVFFEIFAGQHTVECEGPDGIRKLQTITLTGEVERRLNFVF